METYTIGYGTGALKGTDTPSVVLYMSLGKMIHCSANSGNLFINLAIILHLCLFIYSVVQQVLIEYLPMWQGLLTTQIHFLFLGIAVHFSTSFAISDHVTSL